VSWRGWYRRSWEEHYRHFGWSSLCDDEVEDEAPFMLLPRAREPYFEEWEEPLQQQLRRLRAYELGGDWPIVRRRRRREEEEEEEDYVKNPIVLEELEHDEMAEESWEEEERRRRTGVG
jgi:hypothetical protein